MHTTAENLKVQFRHRQLFSLNIFEYLRLWVALYRCLIVELDISLKLLGCIIPRNNYEEYAEERPPKAHSEAPYHAHHLVFELIHHCG